MKAKQELETGDYASLMPEYGGRKAADLIRQKIGDMLQSLANLAQSEEVSRAMRCEAESLHVWRHKASALKK